MTFQSVMVASRGVSACRIARSLRKRGIQVVSVFSEADRNAQHVLLADRAICIGGAAASDSYLKADAILDAARVTGVQAIHPGFGFLGDNADFAEAAQRLGLIFIGPKPSQIRALSGKASLGMLAAKAGVPRLAAAESSNKKGRLLCIEVQVFGDGKGHVVSLGERDCSIQKGGNCLLAVAPAPTLDGDARHALASAAIAIAESIEYQSAGSIAFAYDCQLRDFFILGAQPQLTIEHVVTECVMGVDLVDWMVQLAEGSPPQLVQADIHAQGVVIQAQIRAEDPVRQFITSTGLVTQVELPEGAQDDAWIVRGTEVSDHYDPLLATIVVQDENHASAVVQLSDALGLTRIGGVETNLDCLRACVSHPDFAAAQAMNSIVDRVVHRGSSVEVVTAGTFSIVVDYPGRIGYWPVGIPPSGPMDDLSHRLANRIVGNSQAAACLEMTLAGPSLKFFVDAVIAIAGARMPAWIDEEPIDGYQPISIKAGKTLRFGSITGAGARTYLAIQGGIDVPEYLGSRTTFTLGGFGGHGGRALRKGDILHVGTAELEHTPAVLPAQYLPDLTNNWRIGVLYGPHAAPEFFTERDIEVLFDTDYEVHFNSNRTGVRLLGPKPEWARADGGEAGLHPSNIHDVAYATGTIDFTGDMPILLGPDGPSLGGFVCPATVVAAEIWKLGQLRPGDRVRFVPISEAQSQELYRTQREAIRSLSFSALTELKAVAPAEAVLAEAESRGERIAVTYRRAGDRYMLVEYGPMVLDLSLRFRAHALMNWLEQSGLPGIIDLTPGIRSLQIHYDNVQITQQRLLDVLQAAEHELENTADIVVPSRVVHLPLSWDDPQTRRAISKYMQSVRSDAPWCPSNIEFIRRINGLEAESDVYDTVFGASYLVLGLGDVYLGAPVATPIDPRHRLVTTKYNPARTWTPENAVGIGGAYLCIYGMEGPGGYQFVGRTLQVYNRFQSTAQFPRGRPWLLQFFDQIRFHPVSAEELLDQRRDFLYGKCDIKIEQTQFRMSDYQRFLKENDASIRQFKSRQQGAFEAERQRWVDSGQLNSAANNKKKSTGASIASRCTLQVSQIRHD